MRNANEHTKALIRKSRVTEGIEHAPAEAQTNKHTYPLAYIQTAVYTAKHTYIHIDIHLNNPCSKQGSAEEVVKPSQANDTNT